MKIHCYEHQLKLGHSHHNVHEPVYNLFYLWFVIGTWLRAIIFIQNNQIVHMGGVGDCSIHYFTL